MIDTQRAELDASIDALEAEAAQREREERERDFNYDVFGSRETHAEMHFREEERQRELNYQAYGRRETHAEMEPWWDQRQRSRNLESHGVSETDDEARLRREETGFLNPADKRSHEQNENSKNHGLFITDDQMKILKRHYSILEIEKLSFGKVLEILREAKEPSPPTATRHRYLEDPLIAAEDRLKEKERVRKVNEKNLRQDRENYL